MAWTQSGQVSAATVLEGVFEFNVVVPNAISTFEAYGTRPNLTGTGLTFVFQDANPDGTPTRTDGISTQFAIHGAARVYQRQVLVGDGAAPGTRVGKLYVQDTTVSPAWNVPGGFLSNKPLRSAATFGRNGFIAVGDAAQVWITNATPPTVPPAISPDYDLNSWSAIDLHAVGMLAPGEDPNLYGVARVGDAEVIVGENLTVIVYRPQPPLWNPRGQTWNPWTRINLAGMAPRHPGSVQSPALRAVAVDEVQEIIRPDLRDPLVNNVRATFLDSDGWVLAVGDDGAAYRFRIHLARANLGAELQPVASSLLDFDPELPGPPLQVLEVTTAGLGSDYDTDSDGYYDGDFLGVASDERTRMIVGTDNKAFSFPRYATFNDRLMLDRKPTIPANVAPASVVWRGVASDNVTWMLVGKGALSNGTPVGAFWYGQPQVESCRVLTDPFAPVVSISLSDCDRDPGPALVTLPSLTTEDYTITDARVSLSMAGEPEHHDELTLVDADVNDTTVDADQGSYILERDIDPDVSLQTWKLNLDRSGQQVEVFVTPDLTLAGALGNVAEPYNHLVEDFVFNRGLSTFPGGSPATLPNGHIRDVITTDVFTGLHVAGTVLAESEASPPTTFCLDPSRDQVAWAGGLHGFMETDASSLLAGFSRFRSADGHSYVDNYESVHQGKGQRYQSMKHYVYGRCRLPACGGALSCADSSWDAECCDENGAKTDVVDLFAPFDARVVQLRSPKELFEGAPPDTDILLTYVQNVDDPWSAYPAGLEAGGRTCSFFDGVKTFEDITRDQGRLALFLEAGDARDYRVAIVFDHVETCLDLSAGSAHVDAGDRVAHFITHGETEVAMWVNDREGRWRAMSYFEELPDELYNNIYALAPWNFAPRAGPALDASPAIPLAVRDQCPVHPETLPNNNKKVFPDDPSHAFDALVAAPWSANGYDTSTCAPDFLWRDGMYLPSSRVP